MKNQIEEGKEKNIFNKSIKSTVSFWSYFLVTLVDVLSISSLIDIYSCDGFMYNQDCYMSDFSTLIFLIVMVVLNFLLFCLCLFKNRVKNRWLFIGLVIIPFVALLVFIAHPQINL